MASFVARGSFAKRSGTGTQAVTGVGFTPKALILFSNGQDGSGVDSDVSHRAWGIAMASEAYSVTTAEATSANLTQCRIAATALQFVSASTGTLEVSASLTSFDDDGFTLNWTTNNTGPNQPDSASIIHYIAFGGDVEAEIVTWALRTGTGTQQISGMGFEPEFLFNLHGSASNQAFPSSSSTAGLGIGATDGLNQFALYNTTSGSTFSRSMRTNMLVITTSTAGINRVNLDLDSLDADGFTVDVTANNSAYEGMQMITLGLRGLNAAVGNFQRSTSTINAISGLGFAPEVLLNASANTTSVATSPDDYTAYSVGLSDASNQAVIAWDYTQNDPWQYQNTDAIHAGENANAVDNVTKLASLDSDGFTTDWVSGSDAHYIGYVAFGGRGLRWAGHSTAASTSATITVPYPANVQPGDLLHVAIVVNDTNAITPEAGWEELVDQNISGIVSGRGALYRKIYQGDEGADATFTMPASDRWIATMFAIRGYDSETPTGMLATFQNSAGGEQTAPSVTPDSPNSLLVCGWLTTYSGSESGIDGTTSEGLTQRVYIDGSGGGLDLDLLIATEDLATTDPTGTRSVTVTDSAARAFAFSFVVNPDSGITPVSSATTLLNLTANAHLQQVHHLQASSLLNLLTEGGLQQRHQLAGTTLLSLLADAELEAPADAELAASTLLALQATGTVQVDYEVAAESLLELVNHAALEQDHLLQATSLLSLLADGELDSPIGVDLSASTLLSLAVSAELQQDHHLNSSILLELVADGELTTGRIDIPGALANLRDLLWYGRGEETPVEEIATTLLSLTTSAEPQQNHHLRAIAFLTPLASVAGLGTAHHFRSITLLRAFANDGYVGPGTGLIVRADHDPYAELREGDEFPVFLPNAGIAGMSGIARVLKRTITDDSSRQILEVQFIPQPDTLTIPAQAGGGGIEYLPRERSNVFRQVARQRREREHRN